MLSQSLLPKRSIEVDILSVRHILDNSPSVREEVGNQVSEKHEST